MTAAITNSVRDAIDIGSLTFYAHTDHPDTLQRVDMRFEGRQREEPKALGGFLERKIFWLGFKTNDASSLVWLGDPWDADYLGVSSSELVREAEILEAQNIIRLEETRHFGSAGRGLLLRAGELEAVKATRKRESSDQDDKPASE